jgi:hypothetical protein
MDELDALKVISDRLEKLSADERARVLTWLNAKYSGTPHATVTPPVAVPAPSAAAGSKKGKAPPKAAKKPKSIIALDKSLNLSPSGKKSAAQFAAEKSPSNVKQKCVVAVYYLRDILELEKISVSGVYTIFKALGWVVPSDLKNTLQQAGTEGWLDTSDAEDIKLTSMGENLIEHSLPPKKA